MEHVRFPEFSKRHKSIILANVVMHFDNAIYAYLVPTIASLLFSEKEQIIQLILGYSFLITSFLAQPAGMLFFSKMAQTTQESTILRWTLIGAGMSLTIIGLIPVGESISLYSILVILFARICIEMCSAGERNIARIYLLKKTAILKSKQLSVWYEISTMVGGLLAGAVGTFFACFPSLFQYWRIPFIAAGILTLLNVLFFRRVSDVEEENLKNILSDNKDYIGRQLWRQRKSIVCMAIVSGFSYVTYVIPFIFMSSFVPLVTTLTYAGMMKQVTPFMVADVLLLGIIGKFCKKYDHSTIMATASSIVAVSIIPLFKGLKGASLFYITVVRWWLIGWGVVFCCFLTIWLKEQMRWEKPYFIIGFSYVLGSSLLGKPATAICLYLFHWTKNPVVPAYYIALLAMVTTVILVSCKER